MKVSPLRQFIAQLESVDELFRVSVSTDPLLEIAAITDRMCKQVDGGTALLFEHPLGSSFQVATNLFGSTTRVCTALGIKNLKELTGKLRMLLDGIPTFECESLDSQIAVLPEFSRYLPHFSATQDPALIRMTPPDVTRFPFLQSWPDDGSAAAQPCYITLPQVVTIDPDGGTRNCGVYRVQVRGDREVAIQWKPGSGAAYHAKQYHDRGVSMPVAIVLGGDPVTLFSAMFPLPGTLDETTFAGFLRGASLVMADCQSVPLQVPTGAEVVIEGYVEPGETVVEGPFGNHTGFYSPAAPASLMRITSISHRPDAVIPATVVGPPPMEDCWMAGAWEHLLLAFLQKLLPQIAEIHFPVEWVFHQSAVISLEKPQPGMVRNIAVQLWALPWFRSARFLLFVAAETSAHDLSRVAWRAINLIDLTNDMIVDEASGRVAVDATGSGETRIRVTGSAESAALVSRRWKEYLLP